MYSKEKIDEMASHLNSKEVNAKRAERDSIKLKQVEYLLDKVGNILPGVISGVEEWGVYVELSESKCMGLIPAEMIDGKIDKQNYRFRHGNTEYTLGDNTMVKVASVSMADKRINFSFF